MCKWGTTVPVEVTIAADLSHTGEVFVRPFPIDACIAPIVEALERAGIHMRSSCCGHGKGYGEIVLQDGRTIVVVPAGAAMEKTEKRGALGHVRYT